MQVVNLTESDIPQVNKNAFEMLKYYFLTFFDKDTFPCVQIQLFQQ